MGCLHSTELQRHRSVQGSGHSASRPVKNKVYQEDSCSTRHMEEYPEPIKKYLPNSPPPRKSSIKTTSKFDQLSTTSEPSPKDPDGSGHRRISYRAIDSSDLLLEKQTSGSNRGGGSNHMTALTSNSTHHTSNSSGSFFAPATAGGGGAGGSDGRTAALSPHHVHRSASNGSLYGSHGGGGGTDRESGASERKRISFKGEAWSSNGGCSGEFGGLLRPTVSGTLLFNGNDAKPWRANVRELDAQVDSDGTDVTPDSPPPPPPSHDRTTTSFERSSMPPQQLDCSAHNSSNPKGPPPRRASILQDPSRCVSPSDIQVRGGTLYHDTVKSGASSNSGSRPTSPASSPSGGGGGGTTYRVGSVSHEQVKGPSPPTTTGPAAAAGAWAHSRTPAALPTVESHRRSSSLLQLRSGSSVFSVAATTTFGSVAACWPSAASSPSCLEHSNGRSGGAVPGLGSGGGSCSDLMAMSYHPSSARGGIGGSAHGSPMFGSPSVRSTSFSPRSFGSLLPSTEAVASRMSLSHQQQQQHAPASTSQLKLSGGNLSSQEVASLSTSAGPRQETSASQVPARLTPARAFGSGAQHMAPRRRSSAQGIMAMR